MTQGIQKQCRRLPAIEAEGHLIQVGSEMLRADLVPASDNSTLQQGECGFNGIGMNVTANIHVVFVLDGFVLSSLDTRFNHCGDVARIFVGHDDINIRADVFLDVLRKRSRLNVGSVKKPEFYAALTNSDYYLFVVVGPVPSTTLSFTSADPRFINFDSTVQHGLIHLFHGSTNAMAQVPRGFVAHADGSLELIRRHALTSFHDQQDSEKPSFEGELRVSEDRACSDAEKVLGDTK